jgi:hypothetical protein
MARTKRMTHRTTSGTADVVGYQITVRGRLDETWFGPLERVAVRFEPSPDGMGVTVLTGDFDQASLRGLLSRLWDMNLSVVSVTTDAIPRRD